MPAITDEIDYELTSTERIKELNELMQKEIKELKDELEENEMVHRVTRTISSVPLPKDGDHFGNERELRIKRALEVSEAKDLVIQAERMERELNNCFDSDYKPEGFPLLLHQFFTERMHQLVQCKHMHMLRWRRFCEHTNTIEALYPFYNERLAHIMSEYNDCMARAQRLSVAREMLLGGKPSNAVLYLKQDDMLIYLRWLVCHTHSMKKFSQFMRILQWLPVTHKHEVSPKETEKVEDEESSSARIPSKYHDDFLDRPPSSVRSMTRSGLSSAHSGLTEAKSPSPPPFNPLLQISHAVPAAQLPVVAAAAGGGLASDENNLTLPLVTSDFEALRPMLSFLAQLYGIEMDVEKVTSSAEEMELYAAVNRKFKQVFVRQEHMRQFKTYDRVEPGQENWGADHSMHALKQEANWLQYVDIKPEIDPELENMMVQLRHKNNVDELLRVMARFFSVTDPEKVHDSLRSHTKAVRDRPVVDPVSVTTFRTNNNTKSIWKKIYTNPNLFDEQKDDLDLALEEFDDKDTDKVSFDKRSTSARKRRDSYDYFDTIQLLGLDEGEQNSNDPASIQGGYLSFLQLRHLRIRDLQRTCLSVLNYFRSVERMLTIYDGGLSVESDRVKQTSPQDHRKGMQEGSVGGGGGLGSHAYMHNTPMDFKISETEFMEFAEVDNHDDFYCMEEGRVHVQDQRGYYIVYDAATDDMRELEKDLMLICTHYIEKDRDLRSAVGVNRSDSARRRRMQSQAGGFDIPSYAHQEVDRFAVLMDIWSQEAAFLECKKELMDCYIEAYQHVFDRDEKRLLAQNIINLMFRRPRYDFSTNYFIRAYRLECMCFRLQTQLVKDILDTQIREQREYIQKVCREGGKEFGLPYPIIPKQPISVNMSSSDWSEETTPRAALQNVYMLEFHPSLAIAGRIPDALKHSYLELYHSHKPESTTECITLEKHMLEVALKEWAQMYPLGSSFSSQIQKDVFADVFVEDPLFICEIAQTQLQQQEQELARKNQRDKAMGICKTLGEILQFVTARHRLMDAACETEILSAVYKRMAVDMGYDECHLFMRSIQFEFANMNKDAGKPPPLFITAVQEDDSGVDRLTPKSLCMAVHELDESHVGHISFRSRDKILGLLKSSGVESVCMILACQVLHKNALVCAVQQASLCQPVKDRKLWNRPRVEASFIRKDGSSSPDTKSEKSSATQLTGMSSATGATTTGSRFGRAKHRNKNAPEAFLSIQLEKTPSRDLMLNKFVEKKATMGTVLRNPEKSAQVKRELINNFCMTFMTRLAQYSLRGQIIAYYNSILGLLDDFPNIRDTYFMLGDPNEKKTNLDSVEGLKPDARTLRKRPRRVLSEDGTQFINMWFIPHYTELLIMYKSLDDAACRRALTHHLKVVAMLHDILQYLCAHSKLGSSHARLGTKKIDFVSADWGGTEGIGADLREIQKQIDHLEDKTDPDQVATFMSLRRDVMFLEFETAVRFNLKDTFLATGNKRAFKAISRGMHFGLHELSNAQGSSFNSMYLNVPEPLEARDAQALLMFPWRSFMNREGPFPIHFWQWQQIEHNMQLCLAGLKEVERHVANGEILGVSLLMEDVLMSGRQDKTLMTSLSDAEDNDEDEDGGDGASVAGSSVQGSSRPSRPGSVLSERPTKKKIDPFQRKSLSRTTQPIDAYKLLKNFLLLWKRLEMFKHHWGKNKLGVQAIDTPSLYNQFCKDYKKDVLYPVLVSVARRYGQGDMYEGMVADNEQLVMPKGATEMEIRVRQVIKLLELLEYQMIMDVRKKLQKEISLTLSERPREESALPTDLWKKPSIKESFTLSKPHIAEDFSAQLMSSCQESEDKVTFDRQHLITCLNKLASDCMVRERHNFENYSMYYENLLRVHHQLLYQKEQQVKQVQNQLRDHKENTLTEVQCQLADTSQGLLMEITALRAKIAEMRDQSLTQERDIRERVREEYEALVQNLFSASFDIKKKYDEFREEVTDDIFEKITETRREALEEMRKRFGNGEEEDIGARELRRAEELRGYQHDNYTLQGLMSKMRTMHAWKLNHEKCGRFKVIANLKKGSDRKQKDYLELKMLAEQQVITLRQQLSAVRNALRTSEKECAELRQGLDKELRSKKEKTHLAQQKAQSQKQLEEARRANIEKLLEELEDKEVKLKQLEDNQDRNKRMQHLTSDKAKRDVVGVKKKLNHERSLKIDAFQRVDELQTQMYDIESALQSITAGAVPSLMPGGAARPHTATGAVRNTKSRLSSAKWQSSSSRGPTPATWGAAGTPWPANRSPTPALEAAAPQPPPPQTMESVAAATKKMQRPKTQAESPRADVKFPQIKSMGRLRSRLADQLLNELDPPDHHETILKLKELQALKAEKVLF